MMTDNRWKINRSILNLKSEWLELFAEEWLLPNGSLREYWRIEKPHSLIVIPIHANYFILPKKVFRPGVDKVTLDFPGGRIVEHDIRSLDAASFAILQRELNIDKSQIQSIKVIDGQGKIVNSSFSNQKLFVTCADVTEESMQGNTIYTFQDFYKLLNELECLQCAYALMVFQMKVLRGEYV